MCIDIDLYRYCSVKSQFSSTYVWPNPVDAWISHTCEHTFPLSYFHIVCRSSKVFIVIKATKAGGKPCRFRGKTLFVGKFSQDVFLKKGPKVILRNLINLPGFLWPQNSRPRKHWPWKRSLCITRKTSGILALLLCKPFCSCFFPGHVSHYVTNLLGLWVTWEHKLQFQQWSSTLRIYYFEARRGYLCNFFSFWPAYVADNDLFFRGFAFAFDGSPRSKRQHFRWHVHLSKSLTGEQKFSLKCLNSIKIVFWSWW